MLKSIALTAVLIAGISSAAYAGGGKIIGDGQNQNPPTTMQKTSSQPVHHYGGPNCRHVLQPDGTVEVICD